MSNFFNKEDVNKIKILNDYLGMQHRHKPMDLNNAKDLCEHLKYKSCAFLDYTNYYGELNNLLEKYDESMEYYDTASWFNLPQDTGEVDGLLKESYMALSHAENMFDELSNRAMQECEEVLIIVLKAKKDLQKYILGVEYSLRQETLKKVIEAVFEDPEQIEYHYNMEDTFESFIKHVNDTIKLFI